MRYCLLLTLISLLLLTTGCNILGPILYIFSPPAPRRTVQAEYEGLEGKSVATVVYAGPEISTDYVLAQLEIADAVNYKLKEYVDKVKTIPPRRILRYQQENAAWIDEPPEKLCAKFNCDYVLLVTLVEFSTREPGSAYLVRGRLTAAAKLYGRPDGPNAGLKWSSSEDFRVVFPPDSQMAMGIDSATKVRYKTEKNFAKALVLKFVKHKVDIETD